MCVPRSVCTHSAPCVSAYNSAFVCVGPSVCVPVCVCVCVCVGGGGEGCVCVCVCQQHVSGSVAVAGSALAVFLVVGAVQIRVGVVQIRVGPHQGDLTWTTQTGQ